MSLTIIAFAISFLVLLWAGKLLPQAIGGISRILKISEFLTAFFLVALATSIPELFVGISSALQGVSAISLGNVMGANLINLTLVIGISSLLAGTLKGDGKISSQNFWLIFLIALLPIFLGTDGVISRGDGLILIVVFSLYLVKIFHDRQYFHKKIDGTEPEGLRSLAHIFHHFVKFLLGVTLLVGSSFALVWFAKSLVSEYFNNELILFGILFMALGTTLPELMFGVRASLNGQSQAMLGNSLGTIAFNAAGIVGVVSMIRPITFDFNANLLLVSLFLFLAFALFHIFVYTQNRITRREGIILLAVYVAFVAANLHI